MYEEKELVFRILKGDLRAFKILVQQYERLVFYMIQKLVKDEQDVEDLCQDVFIKVYNNLAKFKFQSKLSTWIGQIAYTTTITYLKKQSKYKGKTQDLATIENSLFSMESPEQLLSKKDIHQYINQLIQQLPEQYKVVLTMYHMNELSYQEIEEITGMPEGTVKSYLFRARKLLKEQLAVYIKGEAV